MPATQMQSDKYQIDLDTNKETSASHSHQGNQVTQASSRSDDAVPILDKKTHVSQEDGASDVNQVSNDANANDVNAQLNPNEELLPPDPSAAQEL